MKRILGRVWHVSHPFCDFCAEFFAIHKKRADDQKLVIRPFAFMHCNSPVRLSSCRGRSLAQYAPRFSKTAGTVLNKMVKSMLMHQFSA